MTKNTRFYEIDLLRFVAAFAVVMFHYTFRGFAADHYSALPYLAVSPVTKYGYLGVNLFFIISGFVILMTASNKPARYFVISRITRLYPAFWFCCTVTVILTLLMGGGRFSASLKQYLVNMTMFNGFVGIDSIDGSYWSLFVELQFYFLVFIVLLLGQMHRVKYFLGLWLFLTIITSTWHIKYVHFFLIPDYAAYFIAGALFYIISIEGVSFYKILLIVVSFVVSLAGDLKSLAGLERHFQTQYSAVVVTIVIAAMFLVFFLIATHRTTFMASAKYLFLGSLTYPLYLLHQYIGFMIFNKLYGHVNAHLLLWGTVLAMLCLAYFTNKRIEQVYSRPLKGLLEKSADILARPFAGKWTRIVSAQTEKEK